MLARLLTQEINVLSIYRVRFIPFQPLALADTINNEAKINTSAKLNKNKTDEGAKTKELLKTNKAIVEAIY